MTDSSQYISRTLEKSVRTAAQTFPVVVVSGTRRVGKTELLRHLDPKRPGVKLESYSLPEFDREKPADFWRVFPPPVRIDGTRRFPRLPEALKLLTDGTPAAGAVFLSVPQTQAVGPMAEALPGRLAAFELLSLSLYETEGFAFDQKPYVPQADLVKPKLPEMLPEVLWHRIWHGQFPEIVNAEDEERHALFNDLFRRFTEVDAFIDFGIVKSSDYGRFLRVLASHIAEELQITKIAAQTGVAVQTANAWLAAAQAAGIIYLLPAFTGIAGRQLVKKPKLFFTDTGFAAWLTRVQSAGDLAQFFNRRAFFENFVVMEIRKSWVHNGRRADFSFYRDSRNNCINLIIRDGQTVHPVNIDLTENPRRQQVKSFECLRESGFTVGAGALVCLTEKRWFLTDAAVAHAVHEI